MSQSPLFRLGIHISVGLMALAMILVLAVATAAQAAETAGPAAPTSLRCEYLVNPLGIDMAKPRFFWIVQHAERGQVTAAGIDRDQIEQSQVGAVGLVAADAFVVVDDVAAAVQDRSATVNLDRPGMV